MVEKDPDKLADDLEDEADELEERSKKLKEQTEDVAQDWERKRSDESVPGAPPPTEDEDED
jgi:chaperonin cofactor prefoldin